MRTKHTLLLSLFLLAFTSLLACDVEHPCDPGQKHEQGVCIPPMAAPMVIDAGGMCDEAENESLGMECMNDGDCGCSDPYCALMPGATKGICTVTDCTPTGSDCPKGYKCFDVSMFGVTGYPTFCIAE